MIAKINDFRTMELWQMKSIKNLVIDQKIMAIKIVSFSQCRKNFKALNESSFHRLILNIENMALNGIKNKRVQFE